MRSIKHNDSWSIMDGGRPFFTFRIGCCVRIKSQGDKFEGQILGVNFNPDGSAKLKIRLWLEDFTVISDEYLIPLDVIDTIEQVWDIPDDAYQWLIEFKEIEEIKQ